MIKQIATGVLAAAATAALALSMSTAASATTASAAHRDSDSWGPVFSRNHLAKADGWINVDWDEDQESNTVDVRGRLFDLDDRDSDEGGKCAYVKFESSDFDHDWSPAYSKKYCGFPGFKRFSFHTEDSTGVRVKVCQIEEHGSSPTKCSRWEYIYTAEDE
ncbi:hypothetical protein HTZ77_14085 [Nonomuraea sp. SMC257]|uniref:Uncharacterized protein n=1 Tax=Nonomuraea montanisoli TaxID=2741721 RepID=A0A7Y6M2D8_9ACTN|nr:hypothetical protein [Nonomuraea montanisoli]NUW32553.1 hypothetical protein [Nonomuraea montanisoli]